VSVITSCIDDNFVVLTANKTAHYETNDITLYERLEKDYNGFKGCELIAAHNTEGDWSTWEKHPHGDEIVILLSGQVDFVLQMEQGEECITLNEPGRYVIVPSNTWHRAVNARQAKLLFITPGEGTDHKNV